MHPAVFSSSVAVACAMALLASACGQTGDLYLPDRKPSTTASSPPPPTPPPGEAADPSADAPRAETPIEPAPMPTP